MAEEIALLINYIKVYKLNIIYQSNAYIVTTYD